MTERIGEAEYAVMEVLWKDAPADRAEVAERVPAERGWSTRTVKTMLARLLAKGVLAHEEEGRRYLYRPAVARADYVAQESRTADRPHVRRQGDAAGRPARRARPAHRRRHRRDRGAAEGAQVVTAWAGGPSRQHGLAECHAARPARPRPFAALFGAGPAYALWLLPALRLVLPPLPRLARARLRRSSRERAIDPVRGGCGRALPPDGGPGQWVPWLLALWAVGAAVFLAWHSSPIAASAEMLAAARSAGAHRGLPLVETRAGAGAARVRPVDRTSPPARFRDPLHGRGARSRARP